MNILSTLKSVLKPYGIKPIFYFDRLSIYLDSSTPESKLQPLLKMHKHNRCDPHELPHYEFLDRKLELYQPTLESLRYLNRIIKGDYAINYLEIACDFEADNTKILSPLMAFFDKQLVVDANQNKKEKQFHWEISDAKNTKDCDRNDPMKGSRYYAPSKSKCVFTLYSRELSKINPDKACLHLEWRFSTIGIVRGMSLITLSQLIHFDAVEFWNTHLDIRKPNLTKLGQLFAKPNKTTQRIADNRRGQRKWANISILQEFLKLNPTTHEAFQTITTAKTLLKYLETYFMKPGDQ